jgi:hypothetical protein
MKYYIKVWLIRYTAASDGSQLVGQGTVASCAIVMNTWHSIIRHTFSVMEPLQNGLVTNTTENSNCRLWRHCLQHISHCNHQWYVMTRRAYNCHDSEGTVSSILKSLRHFKDRYVWTKRKAFTCVSSCYCTDCITQSYQFFIFGEEVRVSFNRHCKYIKL